MAYVDGRYATDARPEKRLHTGTSAGGRASLYVGLERPGLFRNLALLSLSLSGRRPTTSQRPEATRPARVRLAECGDLRRGASRGRPHYGGVLAAGAGVEAESVFTHEGHAFGTWRNHAPAMLERLFAR